MAASKGQFVINCQLCESNTKIQWKCIDCNLLICDACKEKIHLKFKNAKDHKVIDIKEIGDGSNIGYKGESDKIQHVKLQCEEHNEKMCVSFCESCNRLLCLACVINHDKTHSIMEIYQGYELKRSDLIKRKLHLNKNRARLTEARNELKRITEADDERYIISKQEIFNQVRNLQEIISKYEDEFITDLERHREYVKSAKKQREQLLERTQKAISLQEEKIDELVSYENAEIFFQEWNAVSESMTDPVLPEKILYEMTPIFCRGEVTKINFGSFIKDEKSGSIKVNLSHDKPELPPRKIGQTSQQKTKPLSSKVLPRRK